jgi:lysozyme
MRWVKHTAAVVALVLASVAGYEGFSSTPYQDGAGVWTNGYGNTEQVTKRTPPVSEPEARATLERQTERWFKVVDAALTRPAGPNQTAAYVSLTHNIGAAAFARSSVVRWHNAGEFRRACDAILLWDKITVNGKLVYSPGLHNRRVSERDTCLKDVP